MAVYYVGFPLLLMAAIFDTTLMTLFRFWGGGPNLVLMIIVSWALLVDLRESLPWAVMGGIFRDLLSLVPTGTSALIFVLIVVAIDWLIPKLGWRNLVVPPLVIVAVTVVYDLFVLSVLFIAGRPIFDILGFFYVIVPGLIENAAMVLVIYRTLGGLNAFLRPTSRVSLLE
ncbi:MAG: rod shape-determining protein MreD [Anaerolineales bacterium]|nr:rod shape-determining protein MreD [Anaerolineales bacterium]